MLTGGQGSGGGGNSSIVLQGSVAKALYATAFNERGVEQERRHFA